MDRLLLTVAASCLCVLLAACDLPRLTNSSNASSTATTVKSATPSSLRVSASTPATSEHRGSLSERQRTRFSWGPDNAQVEWRVDRTHGEATIHLLQATTDAPAPLPLEKIQLIIDAPLTEIELVARPVESDAAGTSSRFTAIHPLLAKKKPLSGSISAMVNKQAYVSDFAEPYDLFVSNSD